MSFTLVRKYNIRCANFHGIGGVGGVQRHYMRMPCTKFCPHRTWNLLSADRNYFALQLRAFVVTIFDKTRSKSQSVMDIARSKFIQIGR